MKHEVYGYGSVNNKGAVHILNRRKFDECVRVNLAEKEIVLHLFQKKNIRSLQQNKYWHGVVVKMFMEAMGHPNTAEDHDMVHGYLKVEVNGDYFEEIDRKTGDITLVKYGKSTADLSTIEFNDLVKRAQQFGAEFYGINIPDPNEIDYSTL